MISVIMCTRNRANQLGRVLESAAAMEVPEGLDWEFLLVDNGSTDSTRDVAIGFTDRLPLRYVLEPTAGLSNARNRGVDEAQGEWICWTDDDVIIDRGWLAGYASAFARHPEVAYFGGPIELHLDGATGPAWFEENRATLGVPFAERLLGDTEIAFDPATGRMPFGANYALRAADQGRHRYDTALGVSPLQRRLGEESAVLYAIAAEGKAGMWVPGSRVLHIIPATRMTLDYVLAYEQSAGETAAYLGHHGMLNFMGTPVPPSRPLIFGVPAYLWPTTAKRWLGYRLARLGGDSARMIDRLRWYGFQRGAINYWRKASRSGQAR